MTKDITFRWLDGITATPEEWNRIDDYLAKKGWMSLNKELSRVRIAEKDGVIIGFSALQMTPYCGPLFVEKSARGTGVAEQLADDTIQFLVDLNARGWIVVANNPHVPPLCEKYGMRRVTQPVYTTERVESH